MQHQLTYIYRGNVCTSFLLFTWTQYKNGSNADDDAAVQHYSN